MVTVLVTLLELMMLLVVVLVLMLVMVITWPCDVLSTNIALLTLPN